MTAAAFIAAALALGYAGHRFHRRQTPSWQGSMLWAVAFGFFLIAMEEISWGQRLFGFATPDVFRTVNVQGEFNREVGVVDFAPTVAALLNVHADGFDGTPVETIPPRAARVVGPGFGGPTPGP